MKYIKLSILLISISCGNNQKLNSENSTNNKIQESNIDQTDKIVGEWEFIKTTDINGNKLENYQGSFGTVQATGPKLIYNKDKTYIKIFTPKNSDKGFWKFNSETSTIEHDLFIDNTDFIGQDLIKKKLAVKKSDGKYYELIEDKILKIENDEMLIDNRGLIDVYKKE
jgi:hypothetical protein